VVRRSLDLLPPAVCGVVQIALDVARGLAFLHGRRLVHFDIKSGNILLDKWVPAHDIGAAAAGAGGPTLGCMHALVAGFRWQPRGCTG
jgi:hypothetical protein